MNPLQISNLLFHPCGHILFGLTWKILPKKIIRLPRNNAGLRNTQVVKRPLSKNQIDFLLTNY